jgi:hypothetical protein
MKMKPCDNAGKQKKDKNKLIANLNFGKTDMMGMILHKIKCVNKKCNRFFTFFTAVGTGF